MFLTHSEARAPNVTVSVNDLYVTVSLKNLLISFK